MWRACAREPHRVAARFSHDQFDEFRANHDMAYDRGFKGCRTFRPNPVTGSVVPRHLNPKPRDIESGEYLVR